METLHNGFTLHIPSGAFPLSTDSMLLADFVRLPRHAAVLDLGSGCGTLGTLLCAADSTCHVTGIEIDETAHTAAVENIRANRLEDRMRSICGDLRQLPSRMDAASFSCCVSNPPYFSAGAVSVSTPLARHTECCGTDDLFAAAAHALKYGGDFFLVHKPERLAELFATASRHGLEPKRLCLLRHRTGSPISLVLIQCRKGGKPGLLWEEESLFDSAGNPTEYHRKLYHLEDE